METTFVRGSFFQMGGRFFLNGQPVDASHWTRVRVIVTARNGARPFAELNVEWVNPEGGQIRVWADDTHAWPVGRARIDAQIRDGYGREYNTVCDWIRIVESMFNAMPSGTAESGTEPDVEPDIEIVPGGAQP